MYDDHSFIVTQASNDYDMDVYEVQRIYDLHKDRFYEELEAFIKNRATQAD